MSKTDDATQNESVPLGTYLISLPRLAVLSNARAVRQLQRNHFSTSCGRGILQSLVD